MHPIEPPFGPTGGPPVEVYTLGRFEVRVAGAPLTFATKAQRKPLELLKVLVALGGEGVHASALEESLWPDSDGDQARNALNTTLSRLRRLIGREALRFRDHRLYVESTCWVDCLALAGLLEQADAALLGGDTEAAWKRGEEALGLYAGPFLDGEYEPPEVLTARARLHGRVLRYVEQAAQFFAAQGEPARAAECYRRGLEIDGTAESLYQGLMGCCIEAGRAAEGMAAYKRCRELLQAHAGSTPSPETEALYLSLQSLLAAKLPPSPPEPVQERPAEPPPASLAGPQRRRISVAHADLSSGAEHDVADPEQVQALLEPLRAEAEQVVREHGGVVNQWVGAQLVALFGVPLAHEDDPHRAVQAMLVLRARMGGGTGAATPYVPAIGIASGLVVTSDPDPRSGAYAVSGNALQRAADLARLAGTGDCLLDAATTRLVRESFHTEPLPAGRRSGQDGAPHRVLGPAERQGPSLSARRRGLPFTGRAWELDMLRQRFAESQAGNGQVVTVAGEAGIGKSRLFQEFRRRITTLEARVVSGRCQSYGQAIPYLPFVSALRYGLGLRDETPAGELHELAVAALLGLEPALERHLPYLLHLLSIPSTQYALPDGQSDDELRREVENALVGLITLQARQRPLVLMLEDWQWADDASQAVLHALIDIMPTHAVLLLVNCRPEPVLTWRASEHHTHWRLKPLDASQTERMARGAFGAKRLPEGLAGLLHERTGGNPFFLEELCRALLEQGTVRLERSTVILTRSLQIAELPETVEAVIRSRLDRLDPDALEAVRLAAVLGQEFSRRVLERLHGSPDRLIAALARLTAQELLLQVQVLPEPEYRFKHVLTQVVAYETLLLAERPRLHRMAGEAVEAVYADRIEEQTELLAYHFSHSDIPERGVYYLELAGARAARLCAYPQARRHYQSAFALLEQLPDATEHSVRRAEIVLHWSNAAYAFQNPMLLDALERCLAEAERRGDDRLIMRLCRRIGWMRVGLGRPDGEAVLQRSLEQAEALHDDWQRALALTTIGRALFHMVRHAEAIPHLERSRSLFTSLGNTMEQSYTEGYLGLCLGYSGHFADGLSQTRRALEGAQAMNHLGCEVFARYDQASVEATRGDWPSACDTLAHVLEPARRIGYPIQLAEGQFTLGWAWYHQGRTEEGLALMEESVHYLEPAGSVIWMPFLPKMYGKLAHIFALADQPERAQDYIARTVALDFPTNWGRIYTGWAEATLAVRDSAARPTDIDEPMARAIRLAESLQLRPELALSHLHHARLLHQAGCRDAALSAVARAAELFAEMDMPWWSEQARDHLADPL